MMLPALDPRRAHDLLARFSDLSVLVVGDVMLDRFITGRVARISPEAPVPVVQFRSESVRLGGAANVAHNVIALGGRARLVGLVGQDPAAERLREQLALAGIGVDGLVEDPRRPTTEKVRIVTERHQQVARIDYEQDDDVSGRLERALVESIRRQEAGAHALVVSDYLKGAVTRSVIDTLVAFKRMGAPLLVDPKIPHLAYYAGATLLTPNQAEAEEATHRRIRCEDDAREVAHQFRRQGQCESVVMTRGEHGMWVSSGNVEGDLPVQAREVADVTGAGDTVIAALSLALAAGATVAEAAALANYAAGIVVGKFGTATVTAQELALAVASAGSGASP